MARRSAVRAAVSAWTTAGEQPTVFSLKSRRSLPSRPAVGGEYGAILTTASRGLRISATAHLHGTGVGFQALGAGQRRDGRRQSLERSGAQFLDRDELHIVGRAEASAQAGCAGSGQDVVRSGGVVARGLGAG